jgi:glucan phosphoethanolaminetransferase (alkaline phosphatase superfamily)
VIRQNQGNLTGRFVVELGQNLYFVGVVLTYLLWGAILKLRETRTRLIQLVLALGIYFSANAGTYALRNLFPNLESSVLHVIFPILGVWLPAAWAYTFLRVSDEARLIPAQLSVRS